MDPVVSEEETTGFLPLLAWDWLCNDGIRWEDGERKALTNGTACAILVLPNRVGPYR